LVGLTVGKWVGGLDGETDGKVVDGGGVGTIVGTMVGSIVGVSEGETDGKVVVG